MLSHVSYCLPGSQARSSTKQVTPGEPWACLLKSGGGRTSGRSPDDKLFPPLCLVLEQLWWGQSSSLSCCCKSWFCWILVYAFRSATKTLGPWRHSSLLTHEFRDAKCARQGHGAKDTSARLPAAEWVASALRPAAAWLHRACLVFQRVKISFILAPTSKLAHPPSLRLLSHHLIFAGEKKSASILLTDCLL